MEPALAKKALKIDFVETATQIQLSHEASCPEISPVHCAKAGGIDPHEHHQGITLSRLASTLSAGLGQGWQVRAMLPFDVKHLSIAYTDAEGQPFEPPYGNIHHRNETLTGLGDAELELQHYFTVGEGWVIGGGLGTTLPLGRTEANPYALAAQGKSHQHMQMGSGTVDPIGRFSVVLGGTRWGFFSNAQGRLPLMENQAGYSPSATVRVQMGPSWRATTRLMLLGTLGASHDTAATWAGEPDPKSGRTAVQTGMTGFFRVSPTVATMLQLQSTVAQWSREVLILQRFVGSIGVSITPGAQSHGH